MTSHQRFIFGRWQSSEHALTEAEAGEICAEAARRQTEFRELELERIFQVLSRLQKIWAAPESRYRKLSLDRLPEMTGFSPKMIERGLAELAATLNPDVLERKIATELRGIPRAPLTHYESSSGRFLSYEGLGTLFHVLSGNVFLVGPGSLLEGVLTGNVNIFKMSSSDTFFLPLFIESLEEADPEKILVSRLAVLDVSSRQTEVLDVFKKNVDGVVVWGGEEAAQSFRQGLPARVRFVMFGPKLSFALVTQTGIETLGMEVVARRLAEELLVWDQNACTAPQICFVEGRVNCEPLALALAHQLRVLESDFPSGRPSSDTAAEIRKLRGVAEVAEARGRGRVIDSGRESLAYTILIEEDLAFETSPLHRTLRMMAYENFQDIVHLTKPFKGYLQTVGIAGSDAEILSLGQRLGLCGAQRILPLGSMAGGEIDDPHDGAYDLPQLMNLVVGRMSPASPLDPWDLMPRDQRFRIQNDRFLRVLRAAGQSLHYKESLGNYSCGLNSLAELPLMDRATWEAKMYPATRELETRESLGGYVTRSGGSSGKPKFSYFDKSDWQAMVRSAARMLRSSGFSERDRVANLMNAGELYGSFVSFDHVCFELGAQIFAMGGTIGEEDFFQFCEGFGVNAVMGFPPKILALCRAAKARNPAFKLQKVLFAGQPMSPADQRFLREDCGAEILCSIIGSTEANHLAYQCPQQRENFFHIPEDYNWLEIVDEDGRALGEDQPGRIAVTNLQKTNYPVIRFLNGDSGKIHSRPCACGRQDRVLEYLGRSDDIICLGTMNLKYSDFANALKEFPISALQLHGRFARGRDLLTVKIETTHPDDLSVTKLLEKLMQSISELRHQCEDVRSLEVVVELLPMGAIERNSRTGKIREIVDER